VPVIWSAAGEHRKATVPPSCAGETKSRDGCFWASSALSASFPDAAAKQLDIDQKFDAIKAGIDYRFGFGGPVVAKY
jgi:hypothetical protein